MNKIDHSYTPVALFVYNRLDNTKRVIEALKNNELAPETEVFVFSDAAKDERQSAKVQAVRDYLKTTTGFKSFTVIERPYNYYIEKNIIDGVTEIVNKYGKIIVLEDDGVTAKNFLTFMNNALDYYENHGKVMHVATFTFIKMPPDFNKTFLWRYSENTGGGWGTWKRAWSKFKWFQTEDEGLSELSPEQISKIELDGTFTCLGSLKLKPIPWDICWYITIVKNNGLAVNSPWALTKNNGLFNGTHTGPLNKILGKHPLDVELNEEKEIIFENEISENHMAIDLLKDFYSKYGRRKRDKILNFFVKILVKLKITKLLKRILK